jgi:hypothetical protein
MPKMASVSKPLWEIRGSTLHGKGVFATQDIAKGAMILREKPLVVIQGEGDGPPSFKSVWQVYKILPDELKPAWDLLYNTKDQKFMSSIVQKVGEKDNPELCANTVAKYLTNVFGQGNGTTVLFTTASTFNHSCSPNAIPHGDFGDFEIRALTKIRQGEEIFISYAFLDLTRQARQAHLRKMGFDCACPLCKDPLCEAQIRRDTINENLDKLMALKSPVDLRKQIEIYTDILELQEKDDCLTFEALST